MDHAVNQAAMNALTSMLPDIVREIRAAPDLESARPWLYRLAGIAGTAYALSREKDGPQMTPLVEDVYFGLDYTLDRGGSEETYAGIRAGHPEWGEAT